MLSCLCHVVMVNGVSCCPIDPMVKGVVMEGKRVMVVVVVAQGCPRLGHSGRVVPVEQLLLLLLLVKVVSAIEVVVNCCRPLVQT